MTQELEIVYGKAGDCALEQILATAINEITSEGTFYIDYPIFAFGEKQLRFDALYTSRRFGLTVFDFSHYDQSQETVEQKIRVHQEYLYSVLVAKLLERPEFRQDRGLVLYPQVLSIHSNFTRNYKNGTIVCTINHLQKYLTPVTQDLSRDLYQCLNGFIQRTTSLHPTRNRNSVKSENTIAGKLKLVENEIANLGYAQKKAAIEPYEGPQRLRGLAGTGKTTVLAMKAALLHISHPEWRILVTFNSSPLYKQFERLIRQFIYEYNKEEPNWDKLTVRHSWGSLTSTGVYTEICSEMGHRPTKLSGKIYNNDIVDTFSKVCKKLLVNRKNEPIPCIYDAVLIDEAHFLPEKFLELIYQATKPPKRIVYAYDDFQCLSRSTLGSPEELFRLNENNESKKRQGDNYKPTLQDIRLDVCYRSPPWIISTALAFGLGIYNDNGIIQMFENLDSLEKLGYTKVRSSKKKENYLAFKRKEKLTPRYLSTIVEPENSILFRTFETREQERLWLRDQILRNIRKDRIAPEDILILVGKSEELRNEFYELSKVVGLYEFGLHAPLSLSCRANFFEKNSIAISDIYRSKGSEAPIVYLIGADYCATQYYFNKNSNLLYTAVTRSRGWVRITGIGKQMERLENEFRTIKKKDFDLEFRYPVDKQKTKLNSQQINDIDSHSLNKEILLMLFNKELSVDDVPLDLKEKILATVS